MQQRGSAHNGTKSMVERADISELHNHHRSIFYELLQGP